MFDLFGKKKKEENEVKEIVLNSLKVSIFKEMEEIKKWNEETFPDATLGGQLEKLEEEYEEYFSEEDEDKQEKELADIFIVLGGLRRWKSRIGCCIENVMFEGMPLGTAFRLLFKIKEKMEINRKRVWKKSGDGKFHHKEGTK